MAQYKDTFILNDKVSPVFKKIVANARLMDRNLGRTQAKIAKLQKRFENFNKVGRAMQQTGGKITATMTKITAGVAALSAGLIFGLNKAADYADNIDKMSQKIGMSAEKYQELNFVLSQNGMNIDNLQMGYKTLTNQMASAQKGNKEAVSLFRKLGVNVKDSNGQLRSADDVFDDSIKSLMRMKNPTERMAYAIKLFGRNAQELAPLLNNGIASYEELKRVAREKGMILSKEEIANAVKYKDTMDKFSKMFETRIAALAIKYMPKVTEYLDRIMSNTALWDKVAVSLARIVGGVVKIVDWFVNLSKGGKIAIGVFVGFLAVLGPIVTIVGSLIAAITGLNTALMFLAANPVVLTIMGWTAAIALVIGGIVLLVKNWDKVKEVVGNVRSAIANWWGGLVEKFKGWIGNMLEWLNNLIEKLGVLAYFIPGLSQIKLAKDVSGLIGNRNHNDNRQFSSNDNRSNFNNSYQTINNYNSIFPLQNFKYSV